jgi:hypothetical protein
MAAGAFLDCDQFTQLLVDQQPIYDELILADIRPTDSWIGNVATGVFPAHSGVEHRLDRFRHVHPNTTKVWTATTYGDCLGTPCDKTEYCIGWGSERITYYPEEQSWGTQLLCFDQLMHVTHSEQQFEQIITDILRPATSAIMSMFLRKRTLQHASRLYYTNAAGVLTLFTYAWVVTTNEEFYFDCSVAPTDCGKLTPQALQVRFNPLMRMGYAGKNPFSGEMGAMIELVTSIETCWELDKLAGQTGANNAEPTIAGNWRFTEWGAANAFWRYGFSGQIGNFMVRTDWASLRFLYVQDMGAGFGANRYRYQLVLPYENNATSGAGGAAGLGSDENTAFDNAGFEISFITHKKGLTALVSDATPINPEMPFSARDFGGKWQFVMDNLGADAAGCVIENKRRNKGQFIADFKLAIRPEYTEFINAYFHKREPMCIPYIDTCTTQESYPAQDYNSCPATCD